MSPDLPANVAYQTFPLEIFLNDPSGLIRRFTDSRDANRYMRESPESHAIILNDVIVKIQSHLDLRKQKYLFKNIVQLDQEHFDHYLDALAHSESSPHALEAIEADIAKTAYNQNMEKVIRDFALRFRVPIVYREPSEASQSLQQNEYSPKPKRVSNKSSVRENTNGFIPMEGLAGKIGDEYLKFLEAHCQSLEQRCPPEFHDEERRLRMAVQEESRRATSLTRVQEPHFPLLKSIPLTRIKGGVEEVLIYKDILTRATEWVPYTIPLPVGAVEVLADENHNPFTADTDAFFIGHPLNQEFSLKFDPVRHYSHTDFSLKALRFLNDRWNVYSENQTEPFQHPDEALYALNDISFRLVAMNSKGELSRFDLTRENPNREAELARYGDWLRVESESAIIPVPTELMQKKSAHSSDDPMLKSMDYSAITRDYNVIRERMAGKAFDPMSVYHPPQTPTWRRKSTDRGTLIKAH